MQRQLIFQLQQTTVLKLLRLQFLFWKRFLKIYGDHNIKFHWVKGHNNDFYNERCDFLANLAAKNSKLIEDLGYINNNLN